LVFGRIFSKKLCGGQRSLVMWGSEGSALGLGHSVAALCRA
jgi:hypothetical protein